MTEIVYGSKQGRRYEIVAQGSYRGVGWEIGNNRGTYPFATIYVEPKAVTLSMPTSLYALDDNLITWCYADEGDRLGDYRDGKAWTVEEITEHLHSVIDQLF